MPFGGNLQRCVIHNEEVSERAEAAVPGRLPQQLGREISERTRSPPDTLTDFISHVSTETCCSASIVTSGGGVGVDGGGGGFVCSC